MMELQISPCMLAAQHNLHKLWLCMHFIAHVFPTLQGEKMSFWTTPLRDVGSYIVKNFRVSQVPSYVSRSVEAYRAKYVTPKNAGMTPYWHVVGVCILVNYIIDYRHLKHERLRKYH